MDYDATPRRLDLGTQSKKVVGGGYTRAPSGVLAQPSTLRVSGRRQGVAIKVLASPNASRC
jgi:hypothetical protein